MTLVLFSIVMNIFRLWPFTVTVFTGAGYPAVCYHPVRRGTVQQPSDAAVPQNNAADVADRKEAIDAGTTGGR